MRINLLVCLAALCLSSEAAGQEFVYPVGVSSERPTTGLPNGNGYQISLGFRVGGHTGVDLDNRGEGGEVRATSAGTVTTVCLWTRENCFGFGNVVIIRHDIPGGPFYSLYAHMRDDSVLVSSGQGIATGEAIGQVGSTGGPRVTGPHLHFAIKTRDQLGCGYIAPGECNSERGQESIYRDPLNFIAARRAPPANLVTYAFTAVIEFNFNPDPWLAIGINVSPGATVQGRFTYDAAAQRTGQVTGQFPQSWFDGALRSFECTVAGVPGTFRSGGADLVITDSGGGIQFVQRSFAAGLFNTNFGATFGVNLLLYRSQPWPNDFALPASLPQLTDFDVARNFALFLAPSGAQLVGSVQSLVRQ